MYESKTRGRTEKIFKKRCNKQIRKHSFVQRTADQWNSLPSTVTSSKTVYTFERRLDLLWKDSEIIYNIDANIPAITSSRNTLRTKIKVEDLDLTQEADSDEST